MIEGEKRGRQLSGAKSSEALLADGHTVRGDYHHHPQRGYADILKIDYREDC